MSDPESTPATPQPPLWRKRPSRHTLTMADLHRENQGLRAELMRADLRAAMCPWCRLVRYFRNLCGKPLDCGHAPQ